MPIDDPAEKTLAAFKEEIQRYVGEGAANFALETVAHLSIIGKPILDSWKDLKQKRVYERLLEVLTETNKQLQEIDQHKVDQVYFKSEEFQTLLGLTVEQLVTTHDKGKLRMLASGLANSVVTDFSTESRKELFIRILRDLAPEHVQVLHSMTAGFVSDPEPGKLAILQPLVANGLVEVSFERDPRFSEPRFGNNWSESDVKRAIREYIQAVLVRSYSVTKLGTDFMKFLGESRNDEGRIK
jgi:hypothetical protein